MAFSLLRNFFDWAELQLVEHAQRLQSSGIRRSKPAAHTSRLQVPESAMANLGADDIRTAQMRHDCNSASAFKPLVLYKCGHPAFTIGHHDPRSFAKMQRHRRIGPGGRHHNCHFAHENPALPSRTGVRQLFHTPHPARAVYSQPWMKRILTALVLIPLVLLLVFLGPRWQWLFELAVAVVAALAGWEYMGMAERSGAHPPRVAVVVALLALFFVNFEWPDRTAAFFGLLSLGLIVYCTFFRPVAEMMADSAASIFCLLYTGFTLLALPTLHGQANGASLVTFLFCVVWAGDVAALYIGRAWGRHRLAPSLSPNKSWEGSLGSVAGSLLAALLLVLLSGLLQSHDIALLSYPDDLSYWLLLAAVVNVAAQIGDLAESALKRSAGVKDSGSLLPGHGGVLDRIDALLLAAPVLWYAQVIHQQF